MTDLRTKACKACEGDAELLSPTGCLELLNQIDAAWELNDQNSEISRRFNFLNFDQTMAFVNAIAWIARKDNHHPDMLVGYNYCQVKWTTHALGGLSENDFICAAKTDALLET